MAAEPLPAEELPPPARVLAELLANLLDDRWGTATGECQITLELFDGGLKRLTPSVRIKPSDLPRTS